MKSIHIIQAGLYNGDKEKIDAAIKNKIVKNWIVPKIAMPNDDVVIYIQSIGFYATAIIKSIPLSSKEHKSKYTASIKQIKLINPPISIGIIKSELPELKWANYPRSITTPDVEISARIKTIISQRNNGVLFKILDNIEELNEYELRCAAYSSVVKVSNNKTKKVSVINRSSIVKKYVLFRARGKCEYCKSAAPFITNRKEPYLEVHHPVALSQKGKDSPINVIALCPNCHRLAHYGIDHNQVNNQMLEIISKKEKI